MITKNSNPVTADQMDAMDENHAASQKPVTKKPAKKSVGKKAKPVKNKKPAKAAVKATKNPDKSLTKTKAPQKGEHAHGAGQIRDVDGMLRRMAGRLATEIERLDNTAKRNAEKDKNGAKRAMKLSGMLTKVFVEMNG